MKPEIHPEYTDARVICACGNEIETRSTVDEIHVEICSSCHPFFTGKQKLVDTAGRVEKFRAKYGLAQESELEEQAEAKAAAGVAESPESAATEGEVPALGEAEEAVKERAGDETSQAAVRAKAIQEAQEVLAAESDEAAEDEEAEDEEAEEVESEA